MTAHPLLSARPCACGHVERIHGARLGIELHDGCRAAGCPCLTFTPEDTDQ